MSGLPGGAMMPAMKRPALIDAKSGIPVYHGVSAAAYQQAAVMAAMQQLQQHQFMPYTSMSIIFNY